MSVEYKNYKIDDYTVRVEVRRLDSFVPPRYAAQASCPVCPKFYNADNTLSAGRAKSAATSALKHHYNTKHKGK